MSDVRVIVMELRTQKGHHPFPFRIYRMEKDGTVDMSEFLSQHTYLNAAKNSMRRSQRRDIVLMMWDGKDRWTRYLTIVRRGEVAEDAVEMEAHEDLDELLESELIELGLSLETIQLFDTTGFTAELVAALKKCRIERDDSKSQVRYLQGACDKERYIAGGLRSERNQLRARVTLLEARLRQSGGDVS